MSLNSKPVMGSSSQINTFKMHPYLFLLLLSSGVSSYFLPLKEMPHLQKEAKYTLIDEMLCLLEAENETIYEKYFTPIHIQRLSCAHNNTEIFIHELKKIPVWKCMKKVQQGMKRLEKTCYILKKSPTKDEKCLEKAKRRFPRFKESLKEFLKWVNQNLDCSSAGRSESGLYLDGKCTCGENPWKSQQGLG